ncbi:aminotransferase class V-fold PLP-dependent enzyme [Candidatus Neomarinimicrobiota bacterium]
MTAASAPQRLLDRQQIVADFPFLKLTSHAKPLVYLDSAATSQKPRQVIDAVTDFYTNYNANVHRAIYEIGETATGAYEGARAKVANLIGAPDPHSIVFTSGTTEAINLVAHSWARKNLQAGDEIVLSDMEHHSNLIPWQFVAEDTGAVLRFIPMTAEENLDLAAAAELIGARTKLVAVVHKSNVLGVENPVRKLANLAHAQGALMLVDAAQSVPHLPVNVGELDCDFLALSGHKMLGPTGIGALYGRMELLEAMGPFMGGGEMISVVTRETATYNDVPWKFEAGTPKIAQAIGLGAAVDYLEQLGLDNVHAYVQGLTDYGRLKLAEVPGLRLFGDPATSSGVLTFALEGIHPHDLAQILDQSGVAVRAGHHCAQPLMQCLGVPATTRASLYIYNTESDLDALTEGIHGARKMMGLSE